MKVIDKIMDTLNDDIEIKDEINEDSGPIKQEYAEAALNEEESNSYGGPKKFDFKLRFFNTFNMLQFITMYDMKPVPFLVNGFDID